MEQGAARAVKPRTLLDGSARAADRAWMAAAYAAARAAMRHGEVPVGAIVVRDGVRIARAANRVIRDQDATAHAELLALRRAARTVGDRRLGDCVLYVTLEPCAMCAGAIVLARVGRVVFGAWDEKAGMAGSVDDLLRHPALNHRPDVTGGVCADECAALLRDFFERRRGNSVDTPPVGG
ncbi:MAG TPA: tRNA adenosine(34) deaminase TadA [Gemmatimonadaceae bacterium]|nr:tRNA adenosine(34) deaminase TadA [Gemmatimonadaceae bacterium]